VDELKQRCPLDELLKTMHLEQYAKPICRSPFRIDKTPSWGIFKRDDQWHWKDFGNDDCGDEISFLARYLGMDEKMDFSTLLEVYQHFAGEGQPATVLAPGCVQRTKPDRTGFGPGTPEQLNRLSELRGIQIEALQAASGLGLLVFGKWQKWRPLV